MRIPLGGKSQDMKSRRSREDVINCWLETNADGSFKRLTRAIAFKFLETIGTGPIRGELVAGGVLYVVSGSNFYKINVSPFGALSSTLVGAVSGQNGSVSMAAIGADTPQIQVLTNGTGYIYKTSDGSFTKITDVNYTPDYSVVGWNDRFWLNKPNSNKFFCSDVLDGLTYNALFFAQADTNSDSIKAMVTLGSTLYPFGANSTEQWEGVVTTDVIPVQRIQGSTLDRGIASAQTLVKFENTAFWLADDFTVRSLSGGQMQKVSDLPFENEVTTYSSPTSSFGFFVDYPFYKCYCLTFPGNDVTWCYDVQRGIWHKRKSVGVDSWRIGASANFSNMVLVGDRFNGNIYQMDANTYTENGVETPATWVTTSVNNNDAVMTYSKLELVADMGVGSIGNVNAIGQILPQPVDPKISYSRSLNGGATYINLPDQSLGRVGEREKKLIWRNPIRVPRTQDLVHKFEVNGDCALNIYEAYMTGFQGVQG